MTSIDTGFEMFDGHIQGADFLDTAKFPTATFKSTKVIFEGDKPVSIEGNLTIKGITKPVTLTVTSFFNGPHPMLKKDSIGANATTVIKRSEFTAGKFATGVGEIGRESCREGVGRYVLISVAAVTLKKT